MNYEIIKGHNGQIIKAWIKNVAFEEEARKQVMNLTTLPFIYRHIAVMPDAHSGKGSTIGSVIPTIQAIIPAAVGVDIGCGMMAVQTSLDASLLPSDLKPLRNAIEKAIPHGRTNYGGRNDRGAWHNIPPSVANRWEELKQNYTELGKKHPRALSNNNINHLGTLGTGNHFIEVCVDEDHKVWFMLHSGSRGCGNRIGTYFIEVARNSMKSKSVELVDRDLAYFIEGEELYNDYLKAVRWAQAFALSNREEMMSRVVQAAKKILSRFNLTNVQVNCHHNYINLETHFGKEIWVTRKGAISAKYGELGIIPGSMGAKSFIVRGLGNAESFCSCSHGAGRLMSRTKSKSSFTLKDHRNATAGIECRKDKEVLDETPGAYKDIDSVMAAQSDLVEGIYVLRQLVCVKG